MVFLANVRSMYVQRVKKSNFFSFLGDTHHNSFISKGNKKKPLKKADSISSFQRFFVKNSSVKFR